VTDRLQWFSNNETDPAAQDMEGRLMVFVGRGEFVFTYKCCLLIFIIYEVHNLCDSPRTARADRSVI